MVGKLGWLTVALDTAVGQQVRVPSWLVTRSAVRV